MQRLKKYESNESMKPAESPFRLRRPVTPVSEIPNPKDKRKEMNGTKQMRYAGGKGDPPCWNGLVHARKF